MHIPDNYLSPSTCATLFVAMTPIWYYSIRKINKTLSADKIPLIGIGGAFAFILMMFNLPIPDGTTAHAVGGTLIALLLGPYAACIAISVALFIQAIIFGDGGILSFGANCFNIAFILPFTGFFIYKILNKIHLSPFYHKCTIFLSAYISINLAAFFTALELGIQPLLFVDNLGQPLYCPYPLWISIPAMALSHLTIAGIAEGLFTLSLYLFILKTSPNIIYDSQQIKLNSIFSLLAFLIIISPLGLIAEGTAWGEWAPEEILNDTSSGVPLGFIPEKLLNGFNYEAFFPDYTMSGTTDILAYIASAIIGVTLLIIIFKILGSIIYAKNNHFDNSAKIPKWLLTTDEYTPPKDKDKFWQKTLFSITTKLIFLCHHNYPHKNSWLNPSEKLLFIFLTIILINSAQKIFFPLIILAFSLIYLSTLNTKLIISILKPTLISTLFSLIIILPSLLLNNTRLFYLPFKIFITVLLLAYIAQTIPFYRLSKILRLFHIPAIFILTLDLTLKYIVILGDTITNLLISLKLRSVGKNNFKYQSLASISGTTFLKSQIYTKETYHAMICRCFDENYTPVIKHKFKLKYIWHIIVIIIYLLFYFFSEGYFL